ncbi:hypothetical protein SYK_12200 [Pseudodesulfovibrio nedwellii]|uniref:Uncharacterized protein n=1 Tax=Pseudodesulfovibrio nedwellii TaxID=2973072 RepID=A0ABM8AZB0_9BACT|nr:hypothetical protein SYK_12200 [Pseudodesulfovibrio nedwellii]
MVRSFLNDSVQKVDDTPEDIHQDRQSIHFEDSYFFRGMEVGEESLRYACTNVVKE